MMQSFTALNGRIHFHVVRVLVWLPGPPAPPPDSRGLMFFLSEQEAANCNRSRRGRGRGGLVETDGSAPDK